MNSEEQKLAGAAFADFSNKKYSLCVQHLALLSSLKPSNLKVQHNKCVAEFYAGNCKNVESLHKGLSWLVSQAGIKIEDGASADDVDHCYIYYNQAVLYYYLKEFEKGWKVLDKIFPLIQPMDEFLAQKVCLLLLELCLLLNQPDKALTYIVSIENLLLTSKVPDENIPQSSIKKDKTHPFRIIILHFKARCLLRLRNLEGSLKVLDWIATNKVHHFSTIVLKAQAHLLRGNYEAALNEIIVIQEDLDNFPKLSEEKRLIFFNNTALLYYFNKKRHLSLFYMNKGYSLYMNTMEKIKKSSKDGLVKPSLFHNNTFIKVMYNRGLSLLFAKKPAEAFDCFTVAVQSMLRSPLIWLRLAECCIMAYKKGNEEVFNFNNKKKELVTGTVGFGACTKICLNNKLYKDTAFSSETQSYAVPVPSLEFATVCLRNCFALLPSDNNKLRQCVLAACSYVHLTIGDPMKAYKFSTLLLNEAVSKTYKFLGRLYLAEALVILNKFPEAIEILNPTHFADCDPTSELDKRDDWLPNSELMAQAVLHYNLATLLTIKGEYEKASELLKHIWLLKGSKNDIPAHILALALYIELALGRTEVARNIIKQNCPRIFASS